MKRDWKRLAPALGLAGLLALPVAAQQQTRLGVGEQRPWAQGVSEESQRTAESLFYEGNAFLLKSASVSALERYEAALKLWDHPAIHYNMALALLYLERPLELHAHLTAALKYDEGPLDKDMLERARMLKSLVEKQLVRVEITCDVEGAVVRMDGRYLFTAPGRFEEWGRPGSRVITVFKEGVASNDRLRSPSAGEELKLHISDVYTDEELTRYNKKWSAWKPWTLLGAGVAMAAGGGLLHVQARSTYRRFDERAVACGVSGCEPGTGLADLRDRGNLTQRLAWGSYALGGILVTAGTVFVFNNRAQARRLTPDEHEQEMGISLHIGRGEGGVLASLRF